MNGHPREADDTVTHERRELKFALPGADTTKVLAVLSSNLNSVSFGKNDHSTVRSIYFDNHQLVSCRESMDGVSRRTKVRLRWYDSTLARTNKVWLELKHRRNLNISKERFPIQLDRALAAYRYDELHRVILHSLRDGVAEEWLERRSSPTVLVAYRRRHFRDPFTGGRVTVDCDIRGYDQLGFLAPAERFATPLHDLTVIEVKTPLGREDLAASLLYPLKLRVTRSSKYASCCSRMGWHILTEPHD